MRPWPGRGNVAWSRPAWTDSSPPGLRRTPDGPCSTRSGTDWSVGITTAWRPCRTRSRCGFELAAGLSFASTTAGTGAGLAFWVKPSGCLTLSTTGQGLTAEERCPDCAPLYANAHTWHSGSPGATHVSTINWWAITYVEQLIQIP